MKLYQAEWCPFSHRVRAKLTELGIDYELVNVPASSKQRRDLEKVAGTTAIPVLVDGQNVISDSEKKYGACLYTLVGGHINLCPASLARRVLNHSCSTLRCLRIDVGSKHSSSNSFAMARPMPPPAPVTIAT